MLIHVQAVSGCNVNLSKSELVQVVDNRVLPLSQHSEMSQCKASYEVFSFATWYKFNETLRIQQLTDLSLARQDRKGVHCQREVG